AVDLAELLYPNDGSTMACGRDRRREGRAHPPAPPRPPPPPPPPPPPTKAGPPPPPPRRPPPPPNRLVLVPVVVATVAVRCTMTCWPSWRPPVIATALSPRRPTCTVTACGLPSGPFTITRAALPRPVTADVGNVSTPSFSSTITVTVAVMPGLTLAS